MRFRNQVASGAVIVFCSAVLIGCGAPDLSAMKPRVDKQVAAVIYVDTPDFEAAQAGTTVSSGATVSETIHTTTQSFRTQLATTLQTRHLSLCVIAVNDATPYASDISQYAQKYTNVRFDVVSDVPVSGLQGPNISTLSGNPDATAYGIGYLAGMNLMTFVPQASSGQGQAVVQPQLGYVPSSAPVDEQKAFFAGLFTADPLAQVVSMVPVNGPTAVPPIYPSVNSFVYGNPALQAANVASMTSQTPVFFTFGAAFKGPQFALAPGHIAGTHVEDALVQFSTGHWRSGDEEVVDASSIQINTKRAPSTVTTNWATLQPSLAQSPTMWQTDFANLPKATKQMLMKQFGLQ